MLDSCRSSGSQTAWLQRRTAQEALATTVRGELWSIYNALIEYKQALDTTTMAHIPLRQAREISCPAACDGIAGGYWLGFLVRGDTLLGLLTHPAALATALTILVALSSTGQMALSSGTMAMSMR